MSKWIKKGDRVLVIAGNSKGTIGQVQMRQDDRVVVEGVNKRTKHVKSRGEVKGGRLPFEAPIHISNVALVDSEGRRIKPRVVVEGKSKRLVAQVNGESVVIRELRKAAVVEGGN